MAAVPPLPAVPAPDTRSGALRQVLAPWWQGWVVQEPRQLPGGGAESWGFPGSASLVLKSPLWTRKGDGGPTRYQPSPSQQATREAHPRKNAQDLLLRERSLELVMGGFLQRRLAKVTGGPTGCVKSTSSYFTPCS